MDILFIVTQAGSGAILKGLTAACRRQNVTYAIFFTGKGIQALAQNEDDFSVGAEEALACEHTWQSNFGDQPCPLETGSQTANSRLLGNANKVVSL